MKYIVVLGDGMADLPYDELGGKTPLEVAYKPNIDGLAQKSICGMCKTVPVGMKPGSDVANLSVMGYSPLKYYSGRSPLEALSIGVDMAEDDLAIRCNLVTLSNEEDYSQKTMIDYSAGEISSEEAAELIASVQEVLGNENFDFYSGVSYRHCLIKHHGTCGTEYTPPHDISGRVIGEYLPKGLYGEEMLALMVASYDILKEHPVNLKRIAEGKNPANSIWLWGEGSKPMLPNFEELRGLKGAVISAVDLLKGIGLASGMKVIEVEGVTGTVNTNFEGKARACVQAIRDGYDYVYLHMEAPDECGHQGDCKGKVRAIELIDQKVVGYILKELEGEDFRILVCPDHPTPLLTKTHSSEPIPFIIYDSKCIKEGVCAYTENECKTTGLMLQSGDELVELFLQKEEDMQNKEEDIIVYSQPEIADEAEEQSEEMLNDDNEIAEQDLPQQTCVAAEDNCKAEETQDNTTENNNVDDEDGQTISGSEIFAVEGKESTEDTAKIDTKSQKTTKNGDGKKQKKPLSPKQKKVVGILIAIAVLAVIITIAIATPILVINAPKVLVSNAEDFAKPVKDKKQLYFLQKDITIQGDLILDSKEKTCLNIDLNNKVLTVNGTLTLESPKGGKLSVGVKKSDDYVIGAGKIVAKTLVLKNISVLNLASIISADEVIVDGVALGAVNGSIQANKSFNVLSSDMTFDELAFGENITELMAINSNLTFNKATKIDINATNSKIKALSDVGNVNLDSSSELRLFGKVYNDFESLELGTINGGKLVFVDENGGFGIIKNVAEVWVSRNYNGIIINSNKNFISTLDTPQFIEFKRNGSNMYFSLSSVDEEATQVVVNIDGSDNDIVFDIATQNISEDGGYLFNLGEALNNVGNHQIKFVIRSATPEFVRDSDPYYKSYTHYITLDKVKEAKVVTDEGGNKILSFKAVDFAESYDIILDGVLINIKNGTNIAGDTIEYILTGDSNFKPILDATGNHTISIVAKSSKEGIAQSEKVNLLVQITKKLASPELTISESNDSLSWIFSWNKVENCTDYHIEIEGLGKQTLTFDIKSNQLIMSKAELEGYNIATLCAVGESEFYEDSDKVIKVFGTGI